MLDFTLEEITKIDKDHDSEIFKYLSNQNLLIVIFGTKVSAIGIGRALLKQNITRFVYCTELTVEGGGVEIDGKVFPLYSPDLLNSQYRMDIL